MTGVPAMRPIADWDEEFIRTDVAEANESAVLENKASGKFVLNAGGQPDGATKDELAKQVCAFSNAGDGFIVYGIADNKTLDGGVPMLIGRQPIKDWVEAAIPKLVFPPVTQCAARVFQIAGHHEAANCLLVVYVPLSDRRPHWVTNPQEIPYIRAGAHSLPMRPQTLLDISSRGTASAALIEGLNPIGVPGFPTTTVNDYQIQPHVKLLNGPVCTLWSFELRVRTGRGKIIFPSNLGAKITKEDHVYLVGTEPLFPGRSTPVSGIPFRFEYDRSSGQLELSATLHAGSAQPVQRTFGILDIDRNYQPMPGR